MHARSSLLFKIFPIKLGSIWSTRHHDRLTKFHDHVTTNSEFIVGNELQVTKGFVINLIRTVVGNGTWLIGDEV